MEKFSALGKSGFFNSRALIAVTICSSALFLTTFGLAGQKSARTRIRSSVHNAPATSVATAATPSPSPAVAASTYLGGPGFEITWQCATDSSGNVYIAGDAQEAQFPVTATAVQKTYGDGGQDGYVAKYDKNGKLLWSTFLGGTSWDGVYGLAVDDAGNAVVTGVTESSDFPITANAIQKTVTGDAAFVTVISADGTQVLYSTFLGGTISDGGVPLPTMT